MPCACATIRRAARAVTQLYDHRLRGHHIEAPQFALLAMLERLGAPNQTTIGQRFDLVKTTLSRNLKVLKQKRWIESAPGSDGRERRLRLTAGGRRRLAAARPAWKKAQADLRSMLSEHDWEATLGVLNAITVAARGAEQPTAGRRAG